MKTKPKTDEIKIEKGIPIPLLTGGGGKWKNILLSMKDGDSILVSISQSNCIRQTAYMQGVSIARRAIGDKVRIWKTGMKKPLA